MGYDGADGQDGDQEDRADVLEPCGLTELFDEAHHPFAVFLVLHLRGMLLALSDGVLLPVGIPAQEHGCDEGSVREVEIQVAHGE